MPPILEVKDLHVRFPVFGGLLAPITLQAPIYAKPDPKAEVVGYLRLGAKLARSAVPVTKDGCPEGWYAVRPLGFACVGANATVKLDHPLVRICYAIANAHFIREDSNAGLRQVSWRLDIVHLSLGECA